MENLKTKFEFQVAVLVYLYHGYNPGLFRLNRPSRRRCICGFSSWETMISPVKCFTEATISNGMNASLMHTLNGNTIDFQAPLPKWGNTMY